MNTNKKILALAWNIATDPKLYRKLALNPFSPQALQLISERFPGENHGDVILAVIFAEPESVYDRKFIDLSDAEQKKELRRQRAVSSKLRNRLVRYFEDNSNLLNKTDESVVYDKLLRIAFKNENLKEVEKKFSQRERRDTKLLIADIIKDIRDTAINQKRKDLQTKNRSFKIWSIAFTCALIFLVTLLQINKNYATRKNILAAETQNQVSPIHLTIPAIGVKADIESVGVTANNEMDVPGSIADAGWFSFGPRPGEPGSSVIDGHLDGKKSEQGVFYNLYKLRAGDKIYVTDSVGTTTTFVVTGSRTYDPGYVSEVFTSPSGTHLNLITCDGTWDGVKKSFTKRLVVFSDLAM